MDAANEMIEEIENKLLPSDNVSKTASSDENNDHSFDMFDNSFINGERHIDSGHVCKKILFISLCEGNSVRAWDVLLFIPSLAFLLFLGIRWKSTKRKLLATHSTIFGSFHFLVALNTIVALLRSIVAMIADGSVESTKAEIIDRSAWILSLAVFMMTEICVIAYGLAAAQFDSKRSIIRVTLTSVAIASLSALIGGILEFKQPDVVFAVHQKNAAHYSLYGYGGSLYAMVIAICLTVLYFSVIVIPFIPCTKTSNIAMPNKPSFYQYCSVLLLVHLMQAIGSGLLYFQVNPNGLCILNFATFIYMTVYTPLVYSTFLGPFFKTAQPTLLFSYKAQIDDEADEESATNQNSLQFSLTPGSVDLSLENEPIGQSQPIVRNTVNPMLPVLIDGLASPDSVENGPSKY